MWEAQFVLETYSYRQPLEMLCPPCISAEACAKMWPFGDLTAPSAVLGSAPGDEIKRWELSHSFVRLNGQKDCNYQHAVGNWCRHPCIHCRHWERYWNWRQTHHDVAAIHVVPLMHCTWWHIGTYWKIKAQEERLLVYVESYILSKTFTASNCWITFTTKASTIRSERPNFCSPLDGAATVLTPSSSDLDGTSA